MFDELLILQSRGGRIKTGSMARFTGLMDESGNVSEISFFGLDGAECGVRLRVTVLPHGGIAPKTIYNSTRYCRTDTELESIYVIR